MRLLDEIAAEPPVKGPRCSIAVFIDGLAPDDAADLRTALDDPAYMASAICRALRKRHPNAPSEYTIARHRRGACQCP